MALILAAVLAILLCILVVDAPMARLMDRLFHRSLLFVPLAAIGQVPLTLAGPALLVFALLGWRGWRPGERGWLAIACALSATVSIAFKDQLKLAFGRTWPETWTHHNPSLIHDGVYGFFPMHGGEGFSSFPSGHTTAISAVAGVLWWRAPRLRWLWALLVLLTGIGLLGANFHFLGDILAGALLGFACGRGVLMLPLPLRTTAP